MAMYESMLKHIPDFTLYVFTFDDKCKTILQELNLKNVRIVSLLEFEDEALLSVKPDRSRAEYCWTCTPSVIWYVLNHFDVDHCTYIDADLMFYSSPLPLWNELGEKHVLITEHYFTNPSGVLQQSGRFNVQYITVKNTELGREVCADWREKCIDWCYDRFEDGKFGDQKYLDEWPARFPQVHILQNRGGGIATWNLQQYEFNEREEGIFASYKGTAFRVIFYHFHGVKFYADATVKLSADKLTEKEVNLFYLPYLKAIKKQEQKLERESGLKLEHGKNPLPSYNFRDAIYLAKNKLFPLFFRFEFVKFFREYQDLIRGLKQKALVNYNLLNGDD